jgi:peptidoglycan/LPS O-acetylase OafA/YrhL
MSPLGRNLSTLDYLRAFSTLVVVGVHYIGMTGRFPSGMGGLGRVVVLMFFVHTGFVLMLSLERQQARSPDRLWRSFMVRRFFRVYPLSTFVITSILAFGIPSRMTPPNFQFVHLGSGGISSNYLLTMNLSESEPLLSPMWSLPYEFQLYLLLPPVFLLVTRWRGPFPILGPILGPVLGLWCLTLALALAQPFVPHGGRLDIAEFLPCFMAGVVCYQLSKAVSPKLPFACWTILVPLFMLSGLLLPVRLNWPAAWIACLLAALTAPFIRQTQNHLLLNTSGYIAKHSYSIYLCHYFCLWLAFRANHLVMPFQWLIFLVTLVLLPAGLHRLIEAPMIRLGRRLSSVRPASIPPVARNGLSDLMAEPRG